MFDFCQQCHFHPTSSTFGADMSLKTAVWYISLRRDGMEVKATLFCETETAFFLSHFFSWVKK